MGIHATMVDFDDWYHSLPFQPPLVNDFNTSIPEQNEAFKKLLYTHYKDAEVIETMASCHCGKLNEVHRKDVICDVCKTPVQINNEKPIIPSMWIKAPVGVEALVSPELWIMLDSALSTKEINFLDYLTSTDYSVVFEKIASKDTRKKCDKLLAGNIPRGYNNFIRNFDSVIDFLFASNIIDKNKGELLQFIRENRPFFFPKHIPIPSKICFVAESTTSGVYIDEPLALGEDAAKTITSIYSSSSRQTQAMIENKVAKAMKNNARFHEIYDRTRVAKKSGLMRKHTLGGRLDWTGRGVITSIPTPHRYNELHTPWGLSVQLLKYDIINKLVRRGWGHIDALDHVYASVLNPNPLIEEILAELIAEANGGLGISCIFGRNPTLQRGSIQFLYISKVKTNVHDCTISMSAIVLRAPNADFDGDQLNLTLIRDNQMTAAFKRLAPHLWVASLETPHEISGNLELQGPVVDTMANWLHADYLHA